MNDRSILETILITLLLSIILSIPIVALFYFINPIVALSLSSIYILFIIILDGTILNDRINMIKRVQKVRDSMKNDDG